VKSPLYFFEMGHFSAVLLFSEVGRKNFQIFLRPYKHSPNFVFFQREILTAKTDGRKKI